MFNPSPAEFLVFVIDSDPGKITVIDPGTDEVMTTLDGGGKLETSTRAGLSRTARARMASRWILSIIMCFRAAPTSS